MVPAAELENYVRETAKAIAEIKKLMVERTV